LDDVLSDDYGLRTGLESVPERDRPLLVRNFVLTAIFVPVMVYGAVPVARKLAIKLNVAQKR
jgi:hypothetical protein